MRKISYREEFNKSVSKAIVAGSGSIATGIVAAAAYEAAEAALLLSFGTASAGLGVIALAAIGAAYKYSQMDDTEQKKLNAKTEFNKFTMFSGPIYLPWHFILIEKV